MNYCDFSENIKRLRKSRGLTQQALGDKIGLSKAVVSKYENGMAYPSFDVLIRIAQFFGVTTDYLLGVCGSRTVVLSGLTDSQVDSILRLVTELQNANKK